MAHKSFTFASSHMVANETIVHKFDNRLFYHGIISGLDNEGHGIIFQRFEAGKASYQQNRTRASPIHEVF
ncbi:hypothetical protein CFAM422_006397 [Trichoderma lentiforme]|uniref:Uncharacterized protein n=1 Tax=Trichoderma lentiforme TaxID=1567552 RepID=A0A9P4XGA8_9HYPO|nr:hypothetical protein CFAM422_006397 [Trichoderma lentiforme]